MDALQTIKVNAGIANKIVATYLSDLTDAELLVRPVAGANHIAWQLGHLICSENGMVNAVCPGSMPELPAGFKEKYTEESSRLNSPEAFHKKDEYLKLMKQQQEGALTALSKLGESDLDKPAPESLQKYFRTVGQVMLSALGSHALMHCGQWAVVRRKLGRSPTI